MSTAAVDDNPTGAQARLQHARVLFQAGRIDSAAKHLEKTITLDPNLAAAHLLLGKTYAQLGRMEESRRHLATAQQLGLQ